MLSPSSSRRRVRLSVLAASLVAASLLAGCKPATDIASPVGQALARTEAQVSGQAMHGDAAFLLTQGAALRGVSLRLQAMPELLNNRFTFPYSVEYALWTLRDADLPSLEFQMPAPGAGGFDREKSARAPDAQKLLADTSAQAMPIMNMMDAALRCQAKTSTEIAGPIGYGYLSTHQVVALVLAAKRDCFDEDVIAGQLSSYVGRVRDEFVTDLPLRQLTDLQVERAAVLCLVGQCAQVSERFRQHLLRTQGKDGLWVLQDDPLVSQGLLPPEHATALAYYVLARSASDAEKLNAKPDTK